MARSIDSTVDDLEAAVPTAPASPVRLAVRSPQSADEVTRLLQRRLLIVALLTAFSSAFFSLSRYLAPEQWRYYRSSIWGTGVLIYEGALFATGLALAAFLWRRQAWSLPALRAIQYLLVALFTIYPAWTQLIESSSANILRGATGGFNSIVLRMLVDSMAAPWLAIIVGLATLIPETMGRTTAMVATMAVTAMLVTGWMAFTDPVYRAQPAATLFQMGFWIVVASTLGIFGSHKLSELREQVREALELGRYQLQRKIGSGGMGEVYLAEHMLLKQQCAIKLIRPERAGDPQALRRFEREVQATSRLKHWNTVRIFDYGHADDGTFYYVMEYVPGMTLDEVVRRDGPVPAARAVHFLHQVCSALHEAHAIGLIHRDIKPANVMTSVRAGVHDHVTLLDFGLVRDIVPAEDPDMLTLDGAFAGTPQYVAPEQIRSHAPLDARADIYSLGAVAYFLVSGRPPFVRNGALETLFAHLRDAIVPASAAQPGVPADLDAVISRCLAKNPADRFATVAELDAALGACADAGGWSEARAAEWWSGATSASSGEGGS